MLDEKEDLLLAKIIGFIGGMDSENPTMSFDSEIKEAIHAIINKDNLDKYITKFTNLKDQYLSNCKTCKFPCGKSNDYHINKLKGDNLDKKINLLNELYSHIDDISYDELAYEIMRLAW